MDTADDVVAPVNTLEVILVLVMLLPCSNRCPLSVVAFLLLVVLVFHVPSAAAVLDLYSFVIINVVFVVVVIVVSVTLCNGELLFLLSLLSKSLL